MTTKDWMLQNPNKVAGLINNLRAYCEDIYAAANSELTDEDIAEMSPQEIHDWEVEKNTAQNLIDDEKFFTNVMELDSFFEGCY